MLRLLATGLVLVACTLPVFAQAGPDVIVGDVFEAQWWGATGNINGFSIGTESCNVGSSNLVWVQNTNQHPVIGQNMFRLKDGRFEQIGQSWLKHGFYALSNQLCSNCGGPGSPNGSPNGDFLGVGCSDPYSAFLNGQHGNLGPKNEVNPVTGYFPYPVAGNYPSPDPNVGQRLQVFDVDINPASNPGAKFFVEGHYVHPTDAAAGNKNNNASYRELNPGYLQGFYIPTVIGTTQQQKPGIMAWKDNDPTVQIQTIDIPGDGRVFVAFKATPLTGNTFHYEYAVQNLNSDRAIGSFSIEIWPNANVSNIGFHGVPYHSGEPYSNAAWTSNLQPPNLFPGSLTWSCTPYNQNQNASAMRWGNLFNFRFDSDQLPGNITLGLFKPGTPTTIAVPPFCAPKRPTPAPVPPYAINAATSYDFVPVVAPAGVAGPFGDDAGMTVSLPWAFPFYGQTFNQIVISTNGYLAIPGEPGNISGNTIMGNTATPNGLIAGYWDDLYVQFNGDCRYRTLNNRFIVHWKAIHLGDTQLLEFEVILEQSGAIVSTIVNCPVNFGGATATRGIEAPLAAQGLQYSHNTPNSALSGTTIRYEPQNQVPYTSNLFFSGSLGGGPVRMVLVSNPGNPVLTMASYGPGPLNLGQVGVVPIDINSAFGIMDFYGLLTGFPNPAAVTDVPCGQNVVNAFIPPGTVPSGFGLWFGGVDWQTANPTPPNGFLNIANGYMATAP
jgi:hypothetical protein